VVREYIYLGDSPVAVAQGQLSFIHADHLNTPRLVADATGTTVWRWDQAEPFGDSPADENPSALGTFAFPVRFAGTYDDPETNGFYNYFRDLDRALGRYRQSDPIGLGAGLNTYLHVEGDPLSKVDPLGLDTLVMLPMLNNPPPSPQSCGPDYDCPDPVTISFRGVCRAGDTACGQAMRAAGIAGPYYPQTKTYSRRCMLTLGLGVKATSAIGSTVLLNKAPTVAANLGASASTVSALETTAAVANNPITVGLALVVAADQVMKQCECESRR
jgi:RHS repeat-associated protein